MQSQGPQNGLGHPAGCHLSYPFLQMPAYSSSSLCREQAKLCRGCCSLAPLGAHVNATSSESFFFFKLIIPSLELRSSSRRPAL